MNEERQVAIRQPLSRIRWQQVRLLRIVITEAFHTQNPQAVEPLFSTLILPPKTPMGTGFHGKPTTCSDTKRPPRQSWNQTLRTRTSGTVCTHAARCTNVKRWLLTLTPLLALAVTATALLGGQSAHAAVPLAGLQVTVTKSPWCGCCGDYIEILRERGMEVTVIDTEDTAGAKLALGVPPTTWSCHTTEVDGYAVEGHVPLEA